MQFVINGITWRIEYVNSNNDMLRRSDGSITVGVTDNNDKCIYLSNRLRGDFKRKVICHELVHCFCFSFGCNFDIETEEMIADFIATYGEELIYLLDDIMRNILRRVG